MVRTRATNTSDLHFDPEIERTLSRLRRESRGDQERSERVEMANPNQTLRQLTAPNLRQQPLAIEFPELADGVSFELKSGLIHLLPKFHGLSGEDPNKHLAEFHAVCTGMKPRNVTDDQIKLRAFPFSLRDSASDWLYYLTPGSINTWAQMQKAFLEKYFPATKLNSLKKSISNLEQHATENLYDYYERYKKLVASCPYHGYSNQDLVLYLHGGLLDDERRMVNAACGGNILNKTPAGAFEMFSELAEGARQFRKMSSKTVSSAEADSSLQTDVNELKEMMRKFMLNGNQQQVKACGICQDFQHPTDACPIL